VLLDQAQTRPKKTKKKNGGGNTPADNESDTRQRDPKDNPGANRDKWQDVPCDLIPPDIPEWTKALRQVDRNPKRIRPDLPLQEKGYAFPDPNSLAALPVTKQAQKLCAWLSLRAATCGRHLTQAGLKAPTGSAAVWRLATDVNQVNMIPDDPWQPPLKNDKKVPKTEKLRQAVKQLFGPELLAQLRGDMASVEWHETLLQVRNHAIVDLDPTITKEIIWELFEHNFRFEIAALDMVAAASKWVGDEAAVTRKDFIGSVFGTSRKFVIWNDPFPRWNEGLQAKDIGDRRFRLDFLRRVLCDWPDVPPNIKAKSFHDYSMTLKEREALEANILGFYCQTFFDYFGRPPIVPHRLPLHADEELQRELRDKGEAVDSEYLCNLDSQRARAPAAVSSSLTPR
jgi:hypothetical protein